MREGTYTINYDNEFQNPSAEKDQTIVDKLTPAMINSCISNVNPNAILNNGLIYEIGSEDSIQSICYIEYKDDPRITVYGITRYHLTADGKMDSIIITLNSNPDKENDWGGDTSPTDGYVNPQNVLRHELVHSIGILHSPFNSILMRGGLPYTNAPIYIGDDEKSAYKALYNEPLVIEPINPDTTSFSMSVIKGQNVNFKVIPSVNSNPTYSYKTDIYKKLSGNYKFLGSVRNFV